MRLCLVADSEKLQIDAAQHAAFPVPSCAASPRLLRIDTPMPEQLSYTCVDNDRWQRRGRSKRVSPTLLQSSSSRPRDRSRRLRHRCCGHSGTDSGPNSPEDWPARDGAGYPSNICQPSQPGAHRRKLLAVIEQLYLRLHGVVERQLLGTRGIIVLLQKERHDHRVVIVFQRSR
jgi:hypothetical protein